MINRQIFTNIIVKVHKNAFLVIHTRTHAPGKYKFTFQVVQQRNTYRGAWIVKERNYAFDILFP